MGAGCRQLALPPPLPTAPLPVPAEPSLHATPPPPPADKHNKASRKGKTLEQIESEEGGPVKESLVGMAQTRRAAKRKGAVADTDLVEDVEGIEEDLEQEEEDGMKLEAFNLKAGAGGRGGRVLLC